MDQGTKDIIEVTASIINALSVPVTALIAWRGVTQWRKKAREEKNAELAEEILITLANLKNAIRRIRDPISYQAEGNSRRQDPDETQDRTRALNLAYIHIERIRNEQSIFSELNGLEIQANVRLKDEVTAEFSDLRGLIRSLSLAASRVYQDANRIERPSNERDIERRHQAEQVVWSSSDENHLDQFDQELNNVLGRFTTKLAKHQI